MMTKDRAITSGRDENRFGIEVKYRVSAAIREDPDTDDVQDRRVT